MSVPFCDSLQYIQSHPPSPPLSLLRRTFFAVLLEAIVDILAENSRVLSPHLSVDVELFLQSVDNYSQVLLPHLRKQQKKSLLCHQNRLVAYLAKHYHPRVIRSLPLLTQPVFYLNRAHEL